MLHTALLSLTAFMFCLSLFLVHRASVLENDFRKLQGDIMLQLNQPRSEGVNGKVAKMSKTREDIKPSVFQKAQSSLKISSRRVKREQNSCRVPTSFLQLRANTNKQPDIRGNITVIPWTVSAQQGSTISQKENRIVVQEDGYYLVFGQVLCHSKSSRTKLISHMICSNYSANVLPDSQVLFESPSTVMGHIIRSWGSSETGTGSTELLRCLREMPDETHGNTCYSSGTVHLLRGDELELVIPDRPAAQISTDPESTFFGVIQLRL
ncbi:tumor necrosis factor ligand superfamily member 13B-like isoform X1 [Stegastes partitus]|uniref:Tumor necrosis factor ligand superfamily member 13B-like isoform X1 n=1 Tax=Stegastes partitus TaxID=144197 RepID=A0A9Y4MXS5_9TELE|nr:PREDICTED: tumor necrosis factor ligand superfamily member 13B-like isoform X1 [Stegastes partitus]